MTRRKRILVFGANPFPKRDPYGGTSWGWGNALFSNGPGGNFGNCIIGEYALLGIVGNFTNVTHFPIRAGQIPSPEEVAERFDHILVVAANWFSATWRKDFLRDAEWFLRCGLPVTVIGLGQQMPQSENTPDGRSRYARAVPESFIRLLNVWLDLGPSLSVRGEITRDLLAICGIRAVVPTGCPTWFVNGETQPDVSKREDSLPEYAPIAIHADYGHAHTVLRLARNFENSVYVLQSEKALIPYSGLNPPSLFSNPVLAWNLGTISVRRNPWLLHFCALDAWESFLRTRAFSFGYRIHGTVCAIKNGIPAVVVRHDLRISEFVDLFRIPSVSEEEASSSDCSLDSLYHDADFSEMNHAYPDLLVRYRDYLDSHGLKFCGRNFDETVAMAKPFSVPDNQFGWLQAFRYGLGWMAESICRRLGRNR